MIIFKANPSKPGQASGHTNTVAYEIHHSKPDKWDNKYPDKDDVYITVSKTASSSGDLTVDYLHKVFFPAVRAVNGVLDKPAGLVLDAFREHFDKKVKAVTEPIQELLWLLMDGGITPVAQPLDVLINKVFKGFY